MSRALPMTTNRRGQAYRAQTGGHLTQRQYRHLVRMKWLAERRYHGVLPPHGASGVRTVGSSPPG